MPLVHHIGQRARAAAEQHEREHRNAGQQRHDQHHRARHAEGLWIVGQLPQQRLVGRAADAGLGHDHKQDSLDLFAEQGKYIKGKPIVTIFHNEQNLYTVLRIRVEETNEEYEDKEAVITGYFPIIHEQEHYIFYGEMKDHPKFGMQFHATHFRKDIPQTKQGLSAIYRVKFLKELVRKPLKK